MCEIVLLLDKAVFCATLFLDMKINFGMSYDHLLETGWLVSVAISRLGARVGPFEFCSVVNKLAVSATSF